jgi:hypothetical protein
MSEKYLHPFQTFINSLPSLSLDRLLEKEGDDQNSEVRVRNPFQLDSIEINNFKSIISSTLGVENSSFIGGYNSAGKSAHTQLILLLNQWLIGESLSLDGAIPINGPFISLGDSALDLIHRYGDEVQLLDEEHLGYNYSLEKPLTANFHFSINDDGEISKRSFYFKMSPHETSKSSFRIDEISVKDTIISEKRINKLDSDLMVDNKEGIINIFGAADIFQFAEKVTYIKKYTNKSIHYSEGYDSPDFHYSEKIKDAFGVKTAIGKACIPGDAYLSNPFEDSKSISFFTEEVIIDNQTFSINSVHPYNVKISSDLNYSLGKRQPEYLIDTRLAIKSGILFTVYSLIKERIEENIFDSGAQSNLQKVFNEDQLESQQYAFEIIKTIITEILEAMDIALIPYVDKKIRNFDPTQAITLQAAYKKKLLDTVGLLEEYGIQDSVEVTLVLFSILLDSTGETYSKLDAASGYKDSTEKSNFFSSRSMGEDNLFANPELFVELIKDADSSFDRDVNYPLGKVQQVSFSSNIFNNLSNFLTEYTVNFFGDSLPSRSERRFRDGIEMALRRSDLQPSVNYDEGSFNEIVDRQARSIFHALDSHSESIQLNIKDAIDKDPKAIGNLVQTKIDEKANNIVNNILGDANSEEELSLTPLLRLMFLIPSLKQDLNFYNKTYTLLSAINEDSNTPSQGHHSSIYEIPENNHDAITAYDSKPLDYVLMSSFVIPQALKGTSLLKNTDPIFDFRFLNSARGYTNISEFHGGKDVTPLGINGQYTASFLFLDSNETYSGPDIPKGSRKNIINTLFETDEELNLNLDEYLDQCRNQQTVLEHTNDWIKYIFDIDEKIVVTESSYGKYVLYLGDDLLSNVGSGISQALPIIINIIIGENKSIFLEEVEQNLHASAQAKIADMIMFFSMYGRKFIVETHSEHILNRMRLRKIQLGKNLSSENLFNLYFVSNTKENGSVAEKIAVNSKGQFEQSKLNTGFFDQSQLDTLKILKEMNDL